MKRPKPRAAEPVKRLHRNEWGAWHWKPEKGLRPQFKGVALGKDQAVAHREARRLNAEVAAWQEAAAQPAPRPAYPQRRASAVSVSQLVNHWTLGPDQLGSDDWRGKRASTQRIWRHLLKRIEAEFGDDPASSLTRKRVMDWLEPIKRHTPGTARGLITCGRTLFSWAIDKELAPISANPFSRTKAPPSGKRERLWTLEDVRHFVAVCDGKVAPADDGRKTPFLPRPSLGTMLVICFAMVQREWDVAALGQEHLHPEIRNGRPTGATRITFTQSKSQRVGQDFKLTGGKKIDARLPPMVAARLTAHPPPATKAAQGRLCVNEYTGRPYARDSISMAVRPLIARAIACDPQRWGHLKGLTIRDGRRSGFVHLRGLGKTVEEIVNLSGHSLEEGYAIIEHYLPRTAEEADKVAAMMTGEL